MFLLAGLIQVFALGEPGLEEREDLENGVNQLTFRIYRCYS